MSTPGLSRPGPGKGGGKATRMGGAHDPPPTMLSVRPRASRPGRARPSGPRFGRRPARPPAHPSLGPLPPRPPPSFLLAARALPLAPLPRRPETLSASVHALALPRSAFPGAPPPRPPGAQAAPSAASVPPALPLCGALLHLARPCGPHAWTGGPSPIREPRRRRRTGVAGRRPLTPALAAGRTPEPPGPAGRRDTGACPRAVPLPGPPGRAGLPPVAPTGRSRGPLFPPDSVAGPSDALGCARNPHGSRVRS